MGWYKRPLPDSDYDADYAAPPPRKKKAVSLPPSSPPPIITSDSEEDFDPDPRTPKLDAQLLTPQDVGAMEDIEGLEHLPALFRSPSPSNFASGSGQPQTPVPQRHIQRAESLEPAASSPMSVVDVTPLKPKTKRGRPAYTPETRRLKDTVQKFSSSEYSPHKREHTAAMAELERKSIALAAAKKRMDKISAEKKAQEKARWKQLAKEKAVKEVAERKAAFEAEATGRAQNVARLITARTEDGGFNFASLDEFFDALWRRGGNNSISKIISDYVARHGSQHATGMFKRSDEAKDAFISDVMTEIFQREGRAIQSILTRGSTTTVTELLKDFSMNQLEDEIKEAAPTLWAALGILATPDQATRRDADGEARRDKGLVRCRENDQFDFFLT